MIKRAGVILYNLWRVYKLCRSSSRTQCVYMLMCMICIKHSTEFRLRGKFCTHCVSSPVATNALNQWRKCTSLCTYLVQIVRFCGPLVLRRIPASCTPHLHPSYPTRRRTPYPSGPHDTPPPGLRVPLNRSPNAPEHSPLQHTQTHTI